MSSILVFQNGQTALAQTFQKQIHFWQQLGQREGGKKEKKKITPKAKSSEKTESYKAEAWNGNSCAARARGATGP